MTDHHFPILGPSVPPLIGRTEIMTRVVSNLTKTTPSHLSIVGPRYAGKTVLMHGLSEKMQHQNSPYQSVLLWDLAHQTPDSNEAFLKTFCRKLGEELKSKGNEYGDYLLDLETDYYNGLREVLDALNDDHYNTLVLWDSFDKPLSEGKLSRNLWDQLRELANIPSLRFVTASRRTLRELNRHEDSATSNFWNIFELNPVRVGIFDDQDRQTILAAIPGLTFSTGAQSELENWSSGFPPLYLELINWILCQCESGQIDHHMVNDAAENAYDSLENLLFDLWNDCSETAKDVYRHIISQDGFHVPSSGKEDRDTLKEKGFILTDGNKIKKGCRFLERLIWNHNDNSGGMLRLFGDFNEYQRNIRSFLEHRLNHLSITDPSLRRFIQRSIEDIPDHPDVCLSNMRGIVDKALDLIWDAELGTDRIIPEAWFSDWQNANENGPEKYWANKFPPKRGHQIRLLQLLTGTQNSGAKARKISKSTYALVNAAHGFGDFGQHMDGADIPVGVAVSAVMTCLELASCLCSELR